MKTYYSTGDESRDEAIAAVVHRLIAEGKQVVRPNVDPHLPPDFNLTASELRGIYGEIVAAMDAREEQPPQPQPQPEPSSDLPYDRVTGATIAVRPRVQTEPINPATVKSLLANAPEGVTFEPKPPLSQGDQLAAVQRAQTVLAERRVAVRLLTAQVRELRGQVFQAAAELNAGTDGNAEARRMAAVRDHLVASTAERARRAELYGTGVSAKANQFARRQVMVPPGVDPNVLRKGGSRGAAPASYKGRTVPGSPAHLAQLAARANAVK